MKKQIEDLILELAKYYDGTKGSLNHTTPFELLIAVSLSAQCTDARVNIVTKKLFKKYNTPEDFANAKLTDIEKEINSISFYRNKAKHLKEASIQILEKFNGKVPNTMDELITLSGIGRKTANVILLEAFNICEGIAVDTHALRLSHRFGLSNEKDPIKVEQDLLKKIDKKYWSLMNHLFVYHGREICYARNPKCNQCNVQVFCRYYRKNSLTNKQLRKITA